MRRSLPSPGRALLRFGVIAFAVSVTALLAHVVIDALGDFVLAHDAYDAVPHGSRAVALAGALALFAAAAARLGLEALACVRADRRTFCDTLRAACPKSVLRFAFIITVGALPLLGGMEAIDIAGSGGPIDDAAELLAGSPVFSCFVLASVATAVSAALHQAFRFLLANAEALIDALCSLFLYPQRRETAGPGPARNPSTRSTGSVLARRAGLRAPPISSRAVH